LIDKYKQGKLIHLYYCISGHFIYLAVAARKIVSMDKRLFLLIALNLLSWFFLLYSIQKKRKLPNFLLTIIVCFIFLSLIEFSYRAFFSDKPYRIGSCKTDFFKPDSSLGYVIGKNGTCEACQLINKDTLFKVNYTMEPASDPTGRQFNRRIGFKTAATSKEAVFLGCSFTFGGGVNDNETLPWQVGQLANLNTINCGISGYGIHHVYQLFKEQYAHTSNHQRIFVYSFLYDHILRASGIYQWNLQGPYFKTINDSLIHAGQLSDYADSTRPSYAYYLSLLGTFTFLKDMLDRVQMNYDVRHLSQEDYDKCFLMIREMAAAIRRTGGKLILIDWDHNNWANKQVSTLSIDRIEKALNTLSENAVQVIRVSSVIDLNNKSYFIRRDGHPSAAANKKLAQFVLPYIK
jgi:hypothetical protein